MKPLQSYSSLLLWASSLAPTKLGTQGPKSSLFLSIQFFTQKHVKSWIVSCCVRFARFFTNTGLTGLTLPTQQFTHFRHPRNLSNSPFVREKKQTLGKRDFPISSRLSEAIRGSHKPRHRSFRCGSPQTQSRSSQTLRSSSRAPR